jgi:hypothetical protein
MLSRSRAKTAAALRTRRYAVRYRRINPVGKLYLSHIEPLLISLQEKVDGSRAARVSNAALTARCGV